MGRWAYIGSRGSFVAQCRHRFRPGHRQRMPEDRRHRDDERRRSRGKKRQGAETHVLSKSVEPTPHEKVRAWPCNEVGPQDGTRELPGKKAEDIEPTCAHGLADADL